MIFDAKELFKQRLKDHIKELSRYSRYILNEHLSIALLFTIVILAVYYERWISSLTEAFPSAMIVAIIFGLVVTYSPVRTLLKRADIVFLTVAEQKMGHYFKYSLFYSFFTQLYIVFIAAAALAPLYSHASRNGVDSLYVVIIFLLLTYKGINIYLNWLRTQMDESNRQIVIISLRLLLNVSTFYFFIIQAYVYTLFSFILLLALLLYLHTSVKRRATVAWERLISEEDKKMQLFYRLANLFTDVPYLETSIKKRRLLNVFIRKIPFQHHLTYHYLYRITFIRSGDYLGMYVRLLILGGLFIYFVPNGLVKIALGILFIYMSTFQMMTLFNHYRTKLWMDIYPTNETMKMRAIMKLMSNLAFAQTILYTLVLFGTFHYEESLLMLVIGIGFVYLFMNKYVKKKLKKNE